MANTTNLSNDSKSRFGLIFDMAMDGILLLSHPEGRVEEANPAILKQLGFSKEELIGKKLWELGLLADEIKAKEAHNQILKNGFVRYEDIDLIKKNGERFPVEMMCNSYHVDHTQIIQCNIRDISDRRAQSIETAKKAEIQTLTQLRETVNSLSNVIEARDPFTAGHQIRVADLVSAIAKDMGLTDAETEGFHLASLVHDIGKISIPSEILTKPFSLTPLEIAMLRSHAQAGYEILKPLVFPWPVAQYVLEHHERLDGSGYPNGLKGEAISLGARIIAVADTVEAMSSNRPYRPSVGLNAALNQIKSGRGTLFDSRVVDSCISLFKKGYQLPNVTGGKTLCDPDSLNGSNNVNQHTL
jgi:PAS domain S-box-containing protein